LIVRGGDKMANYIARVELHSALTKITKNFTAT
jgi:hypothetical protein